MPKFRIESRNSYQRSENLLGKTKGDRIMAEENSKRKRDICTFDYSTRVMNNHPRSTLTRRTGSSFSHINAREGKGCPRYPRPNNNVL